jgi:hypothetical protein
MLARRGCANAAPNSKAIPPGLLHVPFSGTQLNEDILIVACSPSPCGHECRQAGQCGHHAT